MPPAGGALGEALRRDLDPRRWQSIEGDEALGGFEVLERRPVPVQPRRAGERRLQLYDQLASETHGITPSSSLRGTETRLEHADLEHLAEHFDIRVVRGRARVAHTERPTADE